MELVFMGTGSAYPSPHRGASSLILRTETEGCWMFDCGEGTQTQIMKSIIRPGKISRIFITHLHGDHLFGLPGLMCTISQNQPEDRPPIDIYGPLGLRKYLRNALSLSRSLLGFKYRVNELVTMVSPGEIDGMTEWNPSHVADDSYHPCELPGDQIKPSSKGIWQLCKSGSLSVSASTLKHRITCFGFVIQEDDIIGKLLVERLKELEVPSGPLYGRLKKGETIMTPNGITVHPHDVIGPSYEGRKIVILGDTCNNSNIRDLSMDPDVLVHEATNENAHKDKCIDNGHSTPGMAGDFAKDIRAKMLILTHFSQRYKSSGEELKNGEESVDKLVVEAQESFGPNVFVADDFKSFVINRRTTTKQ